MDDLDQAQQVEAILSRQAEAEVLRISAALIGAPSDGICADCGAPIDPARLKVRPSARRCAECQADFEASKARR